MSANTSTTFNFNGAEYDSNQLSPQGRQLLTLIHEAQNELVRLETRKDLINAAQKQLVSQLKPLLPQPIPSQPAGTLGVQGRASAEIPTTPVEEPKEEPVPLPDNLPAAIKPQRP